MNKNTVEGWALCDEHERVFTYGSECPDCERDMKEAEKMASDATSSPDLPRYSKEYDCAWSEVMADRKLERARRVLSAHELRLIIAHVGKVFIESLVPR